MARASRRGTPRPAASVATITAWAASVMALNGLVGASWGPVLVPAAAHFHLGLLVTGSLFAVRGAASIGGATLAGTLSERFPRHRLIAVYGAALAACLLGVAVAPAWWAVLAATAGISGAFGCVGVETSALTAIAGGARRGRQLSITNAVYSIGATVGPLLVGLLIAAHLSWRLPFLLWSGLALGVLLPFSGAARALPARADAPRQRGGRGAPAWRPHTDLLVLWALAFTYNGVAWSIVGWSATWLTQRFGTGLVLGASSATAFYACLTIGRLTNAWLADRVPSHRLLAVEALLTAAGLVTSALAQAPLPAIAAFALTGLAMGGLYPNIQAAAVGLQPERPGAITATVSVAGAAGTMTVPALTGALGSSAAAMGSLLAWAVVVAALGGLAARTGRTRRPSTDAHP